MKKQRTPARSGATAVEFALVSSLLFLLIFGCIEFSRLMMVEAMIEQTAFEAARNVVVLGATVGEGEQFAERELAFLGVSDPEILVTALSGGVPQPVLDDTSEQVSVAITVRLRDFIPFLPSGVREISRTAVLNTERFVN